MFEIGLTIWLRLSAYIEQTARWIRVFSIRDARIARRLFHKESDSSQSTLSTSGMGAMGDIRYRLVFPLASAA